MSYVITIILAVLGNDTIMRLLAKWLEGLVKDSNNAVDQEYVEAQQRSVEIRVRENRKPYAGNIFLDDGELKEIKNRRTKGPKG